MTYPNGKVLTYNYATGVDSTISRLTSLSDTSGTLESYSYLGLDTVVKRAHSQPGVDLTYIKQTGESNGDAGDQYTGLDRFGRVVDQRWLKTSNGTATDRFKYGYDRDSNALYRTNEVNHNFDELYHASGAGNGYDQLNQLSGFLRGVLSASQSGGTLDTVSNPSTTESWSPDAVGNFSSITTNGSTQTRTHNQQNEITAISSLTSPTYDANGNLTKDEQGQTYTWDAWNRLVQVKNSAGTTIASYKYDGLDRRVQETHGSTVNDLYYSAAWQVIEERTSGVSTATIQYVWSPVYVDALVLRDRSTQNNGTLDERLWVQQDANWNVTALVNGSGTVVERYIYDPYGQVTYLNASFGTISGSAYGWIYGFQGLRLDTATGNIDERERPYRPSIGRFPQNDPAGIGPDVNAYRFEGNGPVDQTDPRGLITENEQKALQIAGAYYQQMQGRVAPGMADVYYANALMSGALLPSGSGKNPSETDVYDNLMKNPGLAGGLAVYGRDGNCTAFEAGGQSSATVHALARHVAKELAIQVGIFVVSVGVGWAVGKLLEKGFELVRVAGKKGIRYFLRKGKVAYKVEAKGLMEIGADEAAAEITDEEVVETIRAVPRHCAPARVNIPTKGHHFNQIPRRGWTNQTITETVQNPFTTRTATNRATGNPATVYYNRDGSHVIVDDVTRDMVQISDRTNIPNWIPDPSIVNPYIPPNSP